MSGIWIFCSPEGFFHLFLALNAQIRPFNVEKVLFEGFMKKR